MPVSRSARRYSSYRGEIGDAPVIHSDRGCHYRWPGWIRICEEHGLIRSISAKGCNLDNAAAEGFFGRLKNEFFYGRDWSGVGYEEFRKRLAAYLTHYNETRIKKSLDWMSPVQYRKHLGLAAWPSKKHPHPPYPKLRQYIVQPPHFR